MLEKLIEKAIINRTHETFRPIISDLLDQKIMVYKSNKLWDLKREGKLLQQSMYQM